MFALEKQMTPIVANSLGRLSTVLSKPLTKPNAVVALELPVKYRMIDIAIAYALPDSFNNQNNLLPFKYLNGYGIGILSLFCVYSKVSIQKMKNELLLEKDIIEKYINKFLRSNLIVQVSKQTYKATEWKSLQKLGLISIELKLCNWKEALEQAEFNLAFSDFSFVALDRSRITNSKEIIPFFKEKNIGLLTVSNNGEMEPLFIPKKNLNYDKQLYVAQRIKIMQDLVLQQKWQTITESESLQ